MYDVCIIGAGVVGCAIARELSRYELRTLLIDRAGDVSQGASKANSGIVHGGYAAPSGTLKAELCAEGNRRFSQLEAELHFGFRRCGSLVLGFAEEERAAVERLYENGIANGSEGLSILEGSEIHRLEPNVSLEARFALRCASVGVASPYELTIALAENAVANGVELRLFSEVLAIEERGGFSIETARGPVEAAFVVNAAGVAADRIAAMVGACNFSISPRKGEYLLFQKGYGSILSHVVFQVPTDRGKGVLVTSTYHGNLLIGPNVEEAASPEDVDTSPEALLSIIETARRSVPGFELSKLLTSFSGVRAVPDRKDFIIEESEIPGFINVAGIESPGLTSAPAIAERVVRILRDAGLSLRARGGFASRRKPIIVPKSLSDEEVSQRVKLDSSPERIVCRCERVSEGEILDCMGRGIPVESVDAVKRRTRAGMGSCQGTFCRPRVTALLARELGIAAEAVRVRSDELTKPVRVKRTFYREVAQGAQSGG